MHLPQQKKDGAVRVLPKRREAIENPDSVWDLLDEFHRIPGVLGTSISTRSGRIVMSDVSNESKRETVEGLSKQLAANLRDVVNRLNMGPLRVVTLQGSNSTVGAAPVGPGMFVSVAEKTVSVAQIRSRLNEIQDELGRVELSAGIHRAGSRGGAAASAPAPSASQLRSSGEPVDFSSPPVKTHQPPPPEFEDVLFGDVALDEMQATEIVDEHGVVMCFIPGGTFLMGSDDSTDEQPIHQVTVRPFLIDKYPVTNEDYVAFLEAQPSWKPDAKNILLDEDYLSHWKNSRMPRPLAQHPVTWVSWWQAVKGYCTWRSGRLPTEAEWEFAGRGNDSRLYPWGNVWRSRRCNHYRLGAQWTSPVGEFPEGKSPFGVMDLSGNVWEWCSDWYSADYYAKSTLDNPQGPPYGRARAIRGGSRFNHAEFVTLTKRLYFPPHRSDLSIGFRCVKPWPPQFML